MGLEQVWPALLGQLKTAMVANPPPQVVAGWPYTAVAGISEGEQFSVPSTPWAWLMNAGGSMPRRLGSDREETTWNFTLRLLALHTADSQNAEHVLMPLVEQARSALRQHVKLGIATTAEVSLAQVRQADWGYVPINDNWYRSLDLRIEVVEKTTVNAGA